MDKLTALTSFVNIFFRMRFYSDGVVVLTGYGSFRGPECLERIKFNLFSHFPGDGPLTGSSGQFQSFLRRVHGLSKLVCFDIGQG